MLVKATVRKDGFLETIATPGFSQRSFLLPDVAKKFKEGEVVELDYTNDKKVVLVTPIPKEKD